MAVYWKGVPLDARSADMLDEVQRLLLFEITPTQGSYSGGSVSASAGTHDGGGAIDLAGEWLSSDQRAETERVARMVGWGMWVRSPSQGNWPWHLHGIAVQPGGKGDQGCLSSGAHSQVIDYYEGRNGLASGAADTGTRDYVGTTWETYSPEEEDMTPEQAAQLAAANEHASEARRMLGVLLSALTPANGTEAAAAANLANGALLPSIAENAAETRRQNAVLLGAQAAVPPEQSIAEQVGTQ